MLHRLNRLLAYPVIWLITLYQRTFSPDRSPLFSPFLRGRICAHEPHCSAYGIQVLKTYGLFPGIIYMIDRISSCTPSQHKKYDPATLRVVFASSAPIGVPFLEKISSDPRYDLVGVVTNPDVPSGRGMKVRPNIIKTTAEKITQANTTCSCKGGCDQTTSDQGSTHHDVITKKGDIIHYTYNNKEMKPHPNKPSKKTQTVSVIIKHPTKEEYILAHHTSGRVIFPGGGIDQGETPQQAAIKEMEEETGYCDIKSITQLTGEIRVNFYHTAKDINYHNTDKCFYIELNSLKQKPVTQEELDKHTMHRTPKEKIMESIEEGESHKIWRNRILSSDFQGDIADKEYIKINQDTFITTPNSLRLQSKKYGQDAKDFDQRIKNKQPDLLVVIAYGKIIPQHILDIPAIAPINVHGSLLPTYRGASPIQSVLLDDESETGITIMRMEAGLDTGPMLSKKSFPLTIHTTAIDIIERFQDFGPQQLVDTMRDYTKNHINETPQDDTQATHCSKLEKSDGLIDPRNQSLHEINNIYRGCYLRPKAHFVLPESRGDHAGKNITIDQMTLDESLRKKHKNKPLIIPLSEGEGLGVRLNNAVTSLTVKPANKKAMSREEFLRGYYTAE